MHTHTHTHTCTHTHTHTHTHMYVGAHKTTYLTGFRRTPDEFQTRYHTKVHPHSVRTPRRTPAMIAWIYTCVCVFSSHWSLCSRSCGRIFFLEPGHEMGDQPISISSQSELSKSFFLFFFYYCVCFSVSAGPQNHKSDKRRSLERVLTPALVLIPLAVVLSGFFLFVNFNQRYLLRKWDLWETCDHLFGAPSGGSVDDSAVDASSDRNHCIE